MTQKTYEDMISLMKNMDNAEKIKYLEWLCHNHFDSRSNGDIKLATRNYIGTT